MTVKSAHIDRFVEQLGRLAEGEGLPRTAGRMMGVLMVCGSPLGIDDLATRLKVSRASISTNSRLLQSLSIADLVSEPGSRRDYLQISGDPCASLLTLGLHRMQSMCAAVREMRLTMSGKQFDVPRARLKRIESFYVLAITQAQAVLARH
jgi:DNA-binding transcriptional regulator GbsR (MarR family)